MDPSYARFPSNHDSTKKKIVQKGKTKTSDAIPPLDDHRLGSRLCLYRGIPSARTNEAVISGLEISLTFHAYAPAYIH
jgi:hypothetical protein